MDRLTFDDPDIEIDDILEFYKKVDELRAQKGDDHDVRS